MEPTDSDLTIKEKFLNLSIEDLNSDPEKDPLLTLIEKFNNVVDSYNFEPNVQQGKDYKIFSIIHNIGTLEEESVEIVVPNFNPKRLEDIRPETCRGTRYKPYEEEEYLVMDLLEVGDIEGYLNMMKDIVKGIPDTINQEDVPSWATKPSIEEIRLTLEKFLKLDIKIFKNAQIESGIFCLVKHFYNTIETVGIFAEITDVTKDNFLVFRKKVGDGEKNLVILVPNIDLGDINEKNTAIIRDDTVVSPIETGDIEEYLNAMKEILESYSVIE